MDKKAGTLNDLKHREEFAMQRAMPEPLETVDLTRLRKECQVYFGVAAAGTGDHHGARQQQRIFKAAITALFEPGALNWLKHRGMG